ncbi:hypothetical protein AXF42_Ash004537 [Apostasia shenzhenica]|uniref:DUF2470 domain-containing protein n=1 Tax=Apostasia shenzhenica TaxID=1088818 RepID=A0A2I0BGX9_9ASPA|nr:hypothetical protein AXF42_Ash004537 [Apostasia shenzhenica]
MELSSIGTLSVVSPDGWPIGVGARFVVDLQGTPALCLREPKQLLANDCSSSFHVQLGQSRSSSRQCTLLGRLVKLDDGLLVKKLSSRWEKKFGENVDEDLIYLIMVKHVLQMEDFEDVVWVTPSEYSNAEPDPLRNFAEQIVYEMGSKHAEDVQRLCNIYVESDFQVTDAKLTWVDRLGFDLHVHSEGGVYAARVPFAREVTDEKGVKSSFNCMFHLAWEVEKGYVLPNFEKVNLLKKVR